MRAIYTLGPAKTYILRGIPRTCAIKSRAVTDLQGNRWPRKGNRGPCNRNRAPFNCTKPVLIAHVPVTVLIVGLRADL